MEMKQYDTLPFTLCTYFKSLLLLSSFSCFAEELLTETEREKERNIQKKNRVRKKELQKIRQQRLFSQKNNISDLFPLFKI